MNDNVIFDDNNNDTIGFYTDLMKLIKGQTKEAIDNNEYEQAKDMVEIMEELYGKRDYDGLLVLSDGNGMGYIIKEYEKGE